MGDCNEQTVIDIWNGKIFQEFRRKMLDGVGGVSEMCRKCGLIKYRQFPEDNLSGKLNELRRYYE
jgi:hypothetical protein